MNIFVLCTGRCGSLTFTKACEHITNYTTAHESRLDRIGDDRLRYPADHIEADNRLSWFLGRLDETYGDHAFYVHLVRSTGNTAASYARRWKGPKGIITAYRRGMLRWDEAHTPDNLKHEVCVDYYHTVNANIRLFLKDKTKTMNVELERAPEHFRDFWDAVGAEGDRDAALAEWDIRYDIGKDGGPRRYRRIVRKAARIADKLPGFLKDA